MDRNAFSGSRSLTRTLKGFAGRSASTRSFYTRPCPVSASSQSLNRHRPRKPLRTAQRCIHESAFLNNTSRPPRSRDRGPKSNEDTQTDFGALDVLRNTATPATAIDVCTSDGFALSNGMKVSGCGVLLVGGEAFRWRPWLREGRKEGTVAAGGVGDDAMTGRLLNAKKQWEVQEGAWSLLELIWPKPDLLIIGTGPHVAPIAPAVRTHLNNLGIRLEVQDTRNAAAQFNLLATERGVGQVAAALIPIGWQEGK